MARAAIASPKPAIATVDPNEASMNGLGPLVLRSMFWRPEYYQTTSAWIEHLPFAFWLVEAQQPSSFVELGCHYGVSYFAFCQAINRLTLNAQAYAVDTWKGDEHAGFYGQEVFDEVRSHNERNYSGFSQLIRSTFDVAAEYFSENSVDLLHIDGLHTYDAVLHDFETWLPKMSKRGIMLFHDTNVHERGFGVYRFFEDLRERYPTFEFIHGHGLGVVGVGDEQTDLLGRLYANERNAKTRQAIQEAFARLGRACADTREIGKQKALAQSLRQQLSDDKSSASGKDTELKSQAIALNDAGAKIKSAEHTIKELREQLQHGMQKDETIAQLRVAYNERSQENERLSGEVTLLRELLRDQARRQEEAAAENASLQIALEQLTAKHQDLAAANAAINVSLGELNTERKTLSVEKAAIEVKLGERTQERDEFIEKNTLIQAALDESIASRSTLSAAKESLTRQLEAAAKSADLMNSNAEELRRSLDLTSRDRNVLQTDLSTSHEELAILAGQIRLSAEEVEGYKAQIAELRLDSETPLIKRLMFRLRPAKRRTKIRRLVFTSGLFDEHWYLARNPDVAAAGVDALDHYLKHGWHEGRNPSELFSVRRYLAANPDVKAAQVDPLLHYILHGRIERRSAWPVTG